MSFGSTGQSGVLKAAFGFSFAHRLVENGASSGVFEESGREQLVVGTETGKICLQGSEAVFHVNERINCLGVYPRFYQKSAEVGKADHDVVIIGTSNSLMALDVFNNKTLFHRDMPEGVNCIKVGNVDEHSREPVIVCGCGTTIWGFRLDGVDLFWTALGDQINALELCDMDGDGQNELIVGTDGIEIKVLKNASFYAEFDEGDPTTALNTLKQATFAFGLVSGVVGVYAQGERLWRVKTKSQIVALLTFPDRAHVACVWESAKIDIRAAQTGEIRSKEQFEGGDLATAFLADLAAAGPLDSGEEQPQLTLVFRNGQVRALEFRKDPNAFDEGQQMREISQRKHALLEELKTYERRVSDVSAIGGQEGMPVERSLVPAGTALSCVLDLVNASATVGVGRGSIVSNLSIAPGRDRESLCLRLALTNEVPIRAALLFAEGIFDSECFALHPNGKESAELTVQFCPSKNVLAELFIKVFAGYSIEHQLRVFEINQILPRFVTFIQIDQLPGEPPESFVNFRLHSRPDQFRIWIAENFVFIDEEKLMNEGNIGTGTGGGGQNKSNRIQLCFICTRNQEPVQFDWDLTSGEVELRHNDIQNVADLVQSMCANMGVRELTGRAHFPRLLADVQNAVDSMDERYQVNERLASELAERLNIVRECVVRAEDALVIRNFAESRRLYARMALLNRELVGHQTVRMAARKELLDGLKLLNVSIDQFARLRVGQPASTLVQECRKAIANDTLDSLPKLLEFGAN